MIFYENNTIERTKENDEEFSKINFVISIGGSKLFV